MTTLRSQISDLASTFISAVLTAIRGSSLEDILAETKSSDNGPRRGPGRPRRSPTTGTAPKATSVAPPARRAKGRLARRSPADIAKALEKVVALVKSSKTPLRAEHIRQKLGMERKEMPRVLQEGLTKKILKSKGQKRATTYSAS